MRRYFLRLFAMALIWPTVASADVFYDVGPGNYPSFSMALTRAAADNPGPFGVTVVVRAQSGTYPPLDLNAAAYALNPQPAFGLVLQAAPGSSPIFSGAGGSGLRVSGIAYVTLQGLGIQGSNTNNLDLESAPHLTVDGLALQGGSSSALTANDCPNLIVRNSTLDTASGVGLFINDCANALISRNTVPAANGASYGFQIQASNGAWVDQNNAGGSDRAFNIYSSSYVTLSANVSIKRGGSSGVVLDNAPFNFLLKNLIVGQDFGIEASASTGCAFMQNTVWDHGNDALLVSSSCDPLRLRNNLWGGYHAFEMDNQTLSTLDSDYQGFNFTGGLDGTSYRALSDWQALPQDVNSHEADDSSFVNAAGSTPADFKLTTASPLTLTAENESSLYTTDYFLNNLAPAPTPWDPGFHVASAVQSTASPTPVLPSPTITPTPSPSPSQTATPSATPSPVGTFTDTPTKAPTFTVTPTVTATGYPIQTDRVITYPNPFHPNQGLQNIVFDPADDVSLKILNQNSQLVIQIPDNKIQGALGHAVWDGRDQNGSLVVPGIYFCIMHSSKSTHFIRFTVLY
jgi:Right handed beta helix region